MEKVRRKLKYSKEGVTLLSLVITIIVIIILATVTINMAFGDNGLIKQAKIAKDMTANSVKQEDESMLNVQSYVNDTIERAEWDRSKRS